MKTKYLYYDCLTSEPSFCWFCSKKTNFIFDNHSEEFFCCFNCFVSDIPLFAGKSKILKKFHIKSNKVDKSQQVLEVMR